ncbi:MAG: hypothetical protein ABW250_18205 [Pyrinomonadaceae bacterium]
MFEVSRLELIDGEATLTLPDGTPVLMRASPNVRALPFDVSVRAFGKEVTFANFAPIHVVPDGAGRTKFVGELLCIPGDDGRSFAAIVGLYSVVFVDARSRSITEILRLRREANEDQGFYQLRVEPITGGFILLYESGAARIDTAGNVVWHHQLRWDDTYKGTDGEMLIFSSEFGEDAPGDWAISIADGTKLKLKQA